MINTRIKIITLLLVFLGSSLTNTSEYYSIFSGNFKQTSIFKKHWKKFAVVGVGAFALWKIYQSNKQSNKPKKRSNIEKDNDNDPANSVSNQSISKSKVNNGDNAHHDHAVRILSGENDSWQNDTQTRVEQAPPLPEDDKEGDSDEGDDSDSDSDSDNDFDYYGNEEPTNEQSVSNVPSSKSESIGAEKKSDAERSVIGFACEQNSKYRRTMEDASIYKGGYKKLFIGVYDGHGGDQVAKYLANNLHLNIGINSEEISKDSIKLGFQITNSELNSLGKHKDGEHKGYKICDRTGSTAVCAIIDSKLKKIMIANAGDSRAVLVGSNGIVCATTDHKISDDNEQKRVIENGGEIIEDKNEETGRITLRIAGKEAVDSDGRLYTLGVTVSRSFGDREFRGVVCDPDILEIDFNQNHEFLILASDGLWDILSNEDAAQFVKQIFARTNRDVKKAARRLMNIALKNGSLDNISVFVVDLKGLIKND
jgi:serine/threonine protein phosphatase PrpC